MSHLIGAKVRIRGCVEIGEVHSIDKDDKYGPMAYVRFTRWGIDTGRWWPVQDVIAVDGTNP